MNKENEQYKIIKIAYGARPISPLQLNCKEEIRKAREYYKENIENKQAGQ